MNEFKCDECGSTKLGYKKYVKCTMPVYLDDSGHITYGLSTVDEDDDVATGYGYVCRDCGRCLDHAGEWIETERDLQHYLFADPAVLAEEQRLHDKYVAEQCEMEEEKERYFDSVASLPAT